MSGCHEPRKLSPHGLHQLQRSLNSLLLRNLQLWPVVTVLLALKIWRNLVSKSYGNTKQRSGHGDPNFPRKLWWGISKQLWDIASTNSGWINSNLQDGVKPLTPSLSLTYGWRKWRYRKTSFSLPMKISLEKMRDPKRYHPDLHLQLLPLPQWKRKMSSHLPFQPFQPLQLQPAVLSLHRSPVLHMLGCKVIWQKLRRWLTKTIGRPSNPQSHPVPAL